MLFIAEECAPVGGPIEAVRSPQPVHPSAAGGGDAQSPVPSGQVIPQPSQQNDHQRNQGESYRAKPIDNFLFHLDHF